MKITHVYLQSPVPVPGMDHPSSSWIAEKHGHVRLEDGWVCLGESIVVPRENVKHLVVEREAQQDVRQALWDMPAKLGLVAEGPPELPKKPATQKRGRKTNPKRSAS